MLRPQSRARAARLYACLIFRAVDLYSRSAPTRMNSAVSQVYEMWIAPEDRPTGETGVDTAFQPCHGLVGVPEDGIHAGDLVVGVMRVAEGTRQVEGSAHTLERQASLAAPRVQNALKACDQRLVGKMLQSSRQPLLGAIQVST